MAIGDSFTEGLSDEDPARPGHYRGWADRLAERLAADLPAGDGEAPPFGYANLAVRGRLLADVTGPQLHAALALRPDLVSIVGGGNDTLRPRADVVALAAQLERAVAQLRAAGADVLLVAPVDPQQAPVLRATRGQVGAFVAQLRVIADRHGAHLIDLWTPRVLRDWRMWAPDRIHLTAEGHRRVALGGAQALGLPVTEDWTEPLPPASAAPRARAIRNDLHWVRHHLAPWVYRRVRGRSSGDFVTAKRPALEPVRPI